MGDSCQDEFEDISNVRSFWHKSTCLQKWGQLQDRKYLTTERVWPHLNFNCNALKDVCAGLLIIDGNIAIGLGSNRLRFSRAASLSLAISKAAAVADCMPENMQAFVGNVNSVPEVHAVPRICGMHHESGSVVQATDRPRESMRQQDLPNPEVEALRSGHFSTQHERVPPIEVVDMCEVYFLQLGCSDMLSDERPILETRNGLRSGKCDPLRDDWLILQAFKVHWGNRRYYLSENNRRPWCLKDAGCTRVRVRASESADVQRLFDKTWRQLLKKDITVRWKHVSQFWVAPQSSPSQGGHQRTRDIR